MSGIAQSLEEQETVLAGGHSTEGMEDHIAIVANGEVAECGLWKKNSPQPGDVLVLTKPLGTGVILAADVQLKASALAVDAAFHSMMQSNREAALLLSACSPSAVTDVTGFGLLGHLLEMMQGDATPGAELSLQQVPLLDGALEIATNGIRSTLYPQLQSLLTQCDIADSLDPARLDLLLDPQTSGGLLIAMSASAARDFIHQFDGAAAVIGEVVDSPAGIRVH